jgi:hypothetical protein
LNRTNQLLLYADDMNLLGDNMHIIKKTTGTSNDTNNGLGREVKAEKTKYMLPSRHQNAGQNHDMKVANRSFENVETTVIDPNLMQEKIMKSLNLGSFCLLVCCLKT